MSPAEARAAARRAFGGVEQVKEHQRDARSFRWLTGWSMDFRLGARMLVKSPGLTVIGVTALAVAIGAGATYLEFTRDLLSPRFSFAGGERLVGIRVWNAQRRTSESVGAGVVERWGGQVNTLEELGTYRRIDRLIVTDDGRREAARGVEITASAFRLVPAVPLFGRGLVEDDERPDAAPVMVIGSELWHTRFKGDANIVGRSVRVGTTFHTIVGVMAPPFGFPANENLWLPLRRAGARQDEEPPVRFLFGRLREGATVAAAEAELERLLQSGAETSAGATGEATSRAALRADVRPYVNSLMLDEPDSGAQRFALEAFNLVFVMLLGICGANVATLVFARTATREAEITVRTALGASRARITAQLFAEALVLSWLAAVVGLAVARFGGRRLRRGIIEAIDQPDPFWLDPGLSPETIAYAFLLAVSVAALIGVVPGLKATGPYLQGRLREAGAGESGLRFGGLWTGVIVTQAALTVMFLATVVSLGWSTFREEYGLGVTYVRERLLTGSVVVEDLDAVSEMPRPVDSETLQVILARLRMESGVVHVTQATSLPGTTHERVSMEIGAPDLPGGQTVVLNTARVGSSFFETVGSPLVAGRLFTDAEILGGHNVVVVDETFARLILRGSNPVGLLVREPPPDPSGPSSPWHEIIGVVKDITVVPRKSADDATIYRPVAGGAVSHARLLVLTRGPAAAMVPRIQAAASSVSPEVRFVDVSSMDQVAAVETIATRLVLRFVTVIASVALLLSTAGIYSLISFTLARRTREIGIRTALGATRTRLLASVFGRASGQIGLGVLLGAVPSYKILTLGVESDTGAMSTAVAMSATSVVCAFIVLVALIACTVPLRRALRIQPTEALRAGR